MSPRNPTPARIEAAKLLKRLNDIDHLPTELDVLELAALNPDDFEPRRVSKQAYRVLAKKQVERQLQENLEALERLAHERSAYFGPDATEYALADVFTSDQDDLFGARRVQDA